jgi:hypothetical protein
VLEAIARFFDGTGAACEHITVDTLGDIRACAAPEPREPGIRC